MDQKYSILASEISCYSNFSSIFVLQNHILQYMKKTIALVTGGFSGEAVISYKSAVTIGNNLDPEKFNVYKIDINPKGWFYEIDRWEENRS